jgi:Na+-translocating ferredoxin:NAD+ oxidoreductase RnfG subunit
VCILSPCKVYASGSMNRAINPADEKIATFDKDEEAAFDPEPAANISPFLHAEHYQLPVYFPGRQKLFVTSHPWVRIIPFAALVMLALATTRFSGKRRQKTILPGNRAASEKIIFSAGIFLIITITAGVANAQITYPVKDAVVSFLGEGREIYQKDIDLTRDVKKILKEKLWWEPQETSIKYYYSKTQDGAVEAYAFVLSDTLFGCGGRHKYCVKVSSKGQVEGVRILELTCYHSFSINNERFLNKFKSLNTSNADNTRIDAVTGATISSNLTTMVVRRALLLFELQKGKADD